MISAANTSASLSFAVYSRNGGSSAVFHSEPARPVTAAASQQTGTTEQNKTADTITLSARGVEQSKQKVPPGAEVGEAAVEKTQQETTTASSDAKNSQELTDDERNVVEQLKKRDREVKTHEQAHLASAGQYARGGPTFTYQQGPDGRRYAIGGEVPIDVGAEKTPEQTIQKMQAVRRAAMAPADPSSADRSIAASASALEAQARQELQNKQNTAAESQNSTGKTSAPEQETDAQPQPGAEPVKWQRQSFAIAA